MTSALGSKALKNIYIGDKQAVIMYKGTDIIWSTKFKVGAIIGQAISTKRTDVVYDQTIDSYTLDTSKAGWTSGNYEDNWANIIYTFPNFPIYKLPNGIKLRFWNNTYGVRSNTTSISASDIAKGVDTIVNDYTHGNINTRVQMNGKNLEIITFKGNPISLYEITAY